MLFLKMNRLGHQPPTADEVEQFDLANMERVEFAKHAIVNIHDDRISNRNKVRILKRYNATNLVNYVKEKFTADPVVKNPHFAVMPDLLIRQWPNSRFVVVFRHPEQALVSAKKVAGKAATSNLYKKYYEQMLSRSEHCIFVSYDLLVQNPERIIKALSERLGISYSSAAAKLVVAKSDQAAESNVPTEIKDLYNQLMELAIR